MTNARPLRAWVRITGTVEKHAGLGWIVDAQVFDHPLQPHPLRLVLKRPPSTEKGLFEEATGRAANLRAQAQRSSAAASSAGAAADRNSPRADLVQVNGRPAWYHSGSIAASHGYRVQSQRAKAEAEALRARADDQIARLPDHLRGARAYAVDLFALPTGQTCFGLPVYDPGMMR